MFKLNFALSIEIVEDFFEFDPRLLGVDDPCQSYFNHDQGKTNHSSNLSICPTLIMSILTPLLCFKPIFNLWKCPLLRQCQPGLWFWSCYVKCRTLLISLTTHLCTPLLGLQVLGGGGLGSQAIVNLSVRHCVERFLGITGGKQYMCCSAELVSK